MPARRFNGKHWPASPACNLCVSWVEPFGLDLHQIDCFETQRKRLEERIAAMHDSLYPDDVLRSVPGVGSVVAAVIRAVVGNLASFANVTALRAYTGLVPREDSSGETRRRARITKVCPSVLRWAL